MAIWTSRYSNKSLSEDRWYPVGISLGKPKWPLGYEVREQCYSLAPKGYMLHMDAAPYKDAYIRKLEDMGKDEVIDIVQGMNERAIEEGKELVLLCYEDIRDEGTFCHRRLFAEWWEQVTGEVVEEVYDPSPVKKSKEQAAKIKKAEKKEKSIPEPEKEEVQYSLFSPELWGDARPVWE